MEYMRGWRALFRDPDWKSKLGIGCVFMLGMFVPVVNIFVQIVLAGYFVLAMRRAVQGQDNPLPRLDFNTDYLVKLMGLGFKPFLARMIYSMVIVPVAFVFVFLFMIGSAMMGSPDTQTIGIVLMAVAWLIYMVAIIAAQTIVTVASLRASLIDDLGVSLKPKAVFSMTRVLLKELIVGAIVLTAISVPMVLAGYLVFFVGVIPVAVILMHVHAFYGAELYKRYLEKGGEPLPVGPIDVPGFEAATEVRAAA